MAKRDRSGDDEDLFESLGPPGGEDDAAAPLEDLDALGIFSDDEVVHADGAKPEASWEIETPPQRERHRHWAPPIDTAFARGNPGAVPSGQTLPP